MSRNTVYRVRVWVDGMEVPARQVERVGRSSMWDIVDEVENVLHQDSPTTFVNITRLVVERIV